MNTKIWDRNSVSNLYPFGQNPVKGDIMPRVYPTEPSRFEKEEKFWPSCATIPAITAYKKFRSFTLAGGVYGIAGTYTKWEDTIKDPVTSADIDASIYSMFTVLACNVSISKKITDKLSGGVGLDLFYGRLKSDVDKNYSGSQDSLEPDYEFRLESESDGIGLQGVFGFLYEFSPKLTLGAVFRTGSKFDLVGDTYVRQRFFGPDGNATVNLAERSNHYHEFEYAPSWGIGVAYKPTRVLTLAFDWQKADWTKFKWPSGNIHFEQEGTMLRNSDIDPDWTAADAYHFGWEYAWNNRLTLRGGFFYEESGIPADGEGFGTIAIGDPIRYANAGFGYTWDVWTLDVMAGTMWGETRDGVVGHR